MAPPRGKEGAEELSYEGLKIVNRNGSRAVHSVQEEGRGRGPGGNRGNREPGTSRNADSRPQQSSRMRQGERAPATAASERSGEAERVSNRASGRPALGLERFQQEEQQLKEWEEKLQNERLELERKWRELELEKKAQAEDLERAQQKLQEERNEIEKKRNIQYLAQQRSSAPSLENEAKMDIPHWYMDVYSNESKIRIITQYLAQTGSRACIMTLNGATMHTAAAVLKTLKYKVITIDEAHAHKQATNGGLPNVKDVNALLLRYDGPLADIDLTRQFPILLFYDSATSANAYRLQITTIQPQEAISFVVSTPAEQMKQENKLFDQIDDQLKEHNRQVNEHRISPEWTDEEYRAYERERNGA